MSSYSQTMALQAEIQYRDENRAIFLPSAFPRSLLVKIGNLEFGLRPISGVWSQIFLACAANCCILDLTPARIGRSRPTANHGFRAQGGTQSQSRRPRRTGKRESGKTLSCTHASGRSGWRASSSSGTAYIVQRITSHGRETHAPAAHRTGHATTGHATA